MIATNNGSFPWRTTADGAALLQALRHHAPGAGLAADARALRDRAMRAAIERQEGAGLDLLTDGVVRDGDSTAVVLGLAGIVAGDRVEGFPGTGASYVRPRVEQEVAWTTRLLVEDYLFAAQGSGRPIKPIVPGPFTIARVAEDRVYGDPMALAMVLAAALNAELRALQAAGAAFIQVDEPALAVHPDQFPLFSRIWEVLGRGVTATLCLHLEGGEADRLYPAVIRLKRLGCLSLDVRAGGTGLQALGAIPPPEGMLIGLGLVDGGKRAVESPDELVRAARAIPGLPAPDRILLGTAGDLGELPVEVAAAKLASLSQAARILERG
jgi:5-methyltetrahydropteroyltriglutamate--homocysteine methyltransferase